MNKIKGQISIGLIAALGAMVVAAVGLGYNAMMKADRANDKVSAVEGDIKSIKTSLEYIQMSISKIEKQINQEKYGK